MSNQGLILCSQAAPKRWSTFWGYGRIRSSANQNGAPGMATNHVRFQCCGRIRSAASYPQVQDLHCFEHFLPARIGVQAAASIHRSQSAVDRTPGVLDGCSRLPGSKQDYLIICCSGQYIRELDFEKEKELVEFIKNNKNKYRFTIYTNCEKGYSFEGITLSPYWKWRTGNKYNNCLVYADPSHLKLNINVNNITFYNKYNFDVPEMNKAKVIDNFETQ